MSERFPLIQYWHDAALPNAVNEALASFRFYNPDAEQRLYNERSAETFIAEHRGRRVAAAFRACALPAMQADYFRYCAVYALGGVYADANFSCCRSLRDLIDGDREGFVFGRQDPVPAPLAAMYGWRHAVGSFRAVTNGLFGVRQRGHPLLDLAIEIATGNIEQRIADRPAGVWVATGPGVFTSLYLLRELGSFDAFISYAGGSAIEPSASLICQVVGAYEKVAAAWGEIDIFSLEERSTWTAKAVRRSGGPHWLRHRESIYR